jgi:hypothetical protein
MPKIPGGQTGAPTVMIAEKAADIIIQSARTRIVGESVAEPSAHSASLTELDTASASPAAVDAEAVSEPLQSPDDEIPLVFSVSSGSDSSVAAQAA